MRYTTHSKRCYERDGLANGGSTCFGVKLEVIQHLLTAFEEMTGEDPAKMEPTEIAVALRVAVRLTK